jgi:NAD(P)-dependent dehydrogenase (short-subunit alcohol dehydrogenase family)
MSYVEQMFGLEERVVVITGGGGVIAGAMSEALMLAGAKVALWDLMEEPLAEARKRLAATGLSLSERLFTMMADATEEESVRKAIAETEKAVGRPEVLINAAGGNRGKSSFLEADVQTFEFVLRLNLVAGFMVPSKVMADYWIRSGIRGAIINLASMASYIPLSGVWAYDAAKAAVLNLTMAAAKELAPHGIRVNAMAPGFFIGKQNKALLIKDEKTGELTQRGKDVISRTPFGRFGEPAELAGTTVFLASERASGFITGVCIPVDGGFLVDNI